MIVDFEARSSGFAGGRKNRGAHDSPTVTQMIVDSEPARGGRTQADDAVHHPRKRLQVESTQPSRNPGRGKPKASSSKRAETGSLSEEDTAQKPTARPRHPKTLDDAPSIAESSQASTSIARGTTAKKPAPQPRRAKKLNDAPSIAESSQASIPRGTFND